MKTTIFNKKALTFFGAAALLLAAVFTIGCKTEISSDPEPETFTVEMKAGEHGTVTANPAIPTNGKVAKDTVITFTANPTSGYKVDKWTITGGAFETGTGTDGSTTAKTKITANTKVNVSFADDLCTVTLDNFDPAKKIPLIKAVRTITGLGLGEAKALVEDVPAVLKTGITKAEADEIIDKIAEVGGMAYKTWSQCSKTYSVDMSTGEHGALITSPVIPSNGKVNENKKITFIALPAEGYRVDKWTITGGRFGAGTGTDGSLTAKVKITANIKISVSFKAAVYDTVSFAALDTYLKNTASPADINYIKVTGLTAADLKGESSSKPSALGKILKDNPSKKVALKLGEIPGIADMSCCFSGCESLTQAPVIPSSVTDMKACFAGCTSLTQAPEIPSSVTDMSYCFYCCTSLTQAPEIPSSVTNMKKCFFDCEKITAVTLKCNYVHGNFNSAFSHCSRLGKNSIKVPAGQVQTYQDNADKMGTEPDRFVAE